MDLADDISYSVHDVEDAVVHNSVSLSVLSDPGRAREVAAHAREWYGRGDEEALVEALERMQRHPFWVPDYDGSHRDRAALKDMTSQLIGRMAGAITEATTREFGAGPFTRHHAQLVVPEQTSHEILILKGIAVHFLMAPREKKPEYRRQRDKLGALVPALAERGSEALEPHFAAAYREASDDAARLRVAVDQVASLTDKSAYDWHHKYCTKVKRKK
jgi:dGTPase